MHMHAYEAEAWSLVGTTHTDKKPESSSSAACVNLAGAVLASEPSNAILFMVFFTVDIVPWSWCFQSRLWAWCVGAFVALYCWTASFRVLEEGSDDITSWMPLSITWKYHRISSEIHYIKGCQPLSSQGKGTEEKELP